MHNAKVTAIMFITTGLRSGFREAPYLNHPRTGGDRLRKRPLWAVAVPSRLFTDAPLIPGHSDLDS